MQCTLSYTVSVVYYTTTYYIQQYVVYSFFLCHLTWVSSYWLEICLKTGWRLNPAEPPSSCCGNAASSISDRETEAGAAV